MRVDDVWSFSEILKNENRVLFTQNKKKKSHLGFRSDIWRDMVSMRGRMSDEFWRDIWSMVIEWNIENKKSNFIYVKIKKNK